MHARAVAFRFSSKGIPQVSDWTTIFDTPSYRMIDLLAKAKKFPQAFRLLPAEMSPQQSESDTWASYPFDESTNLWLNTSHDEALTWFAQILNREKKSLDFAQTFAKRNALKHLSGLQKAPSNTWTVSVLCWHPTSGNIIKWDATTYKNLRDRVGNLITSNGDDFQTKRIEAKSGSVRVSDEPGFEAMEAATDPEDQVIDIGPTCKGGPVGTTESNTKPPQPAPAMSEEDEKILANLDACKDDSALAELYRQACANLNLDPDAEHNPVTARKILEEMNDL